MAELQIRVGGHIVPPHVKIAMRTVFAKNFHTTDRIIYKMKVYVAWEHSSFNNVDLVAIQTVDTQARILNWLIFGKL